VGEPSKKDYQLGCLVVASEQTHTHRHAHTQTDTHTQTQRETHTHTNTDAHRERHTYTRTVTQSQCLRLASRPPDRMWFLHSLHATALIYDQGGNTLASGTITQVLPLAVLDPLLSSLLSL
jgi:hypothetical protein